MNDLALRVGALVIFLGVLGGSFYAAEKAFGHGPPAGVAGGTGASGFSLVAVEPVLNAAPGTTVTFPVDARGGTGETGYDVQSPWPANASSEPILPASASGAAWIPVVVSPDAQPGPQRVVVKARTGNATATLPLTVNVLGPGPVAAIGDTVQVDYVGRFDNGTIFDTSIQSVAQASFDKPEGFTRQQWQPLRLQLGDSAGTITGFWRGILGMQEGQSKTLRLAPELAYGNATQDISVPRTQDVPRLSQVFQRVQHVPRNLLGSYLNASSQAGDQIHVADPQGNNRTYVLEQLDSGNATLRWLVAMGDNFTVFPSWPNMSHAAVVTNDTVQFRTDPGALNGTVTWFPFWPSMSRLTAVNETTITVTHNPPVGFAFALPSRNGPPSQARVSEVGPTTIIVQAPNEHPLAGKTLTFDVTVRSLTKAGTPGTTG